MGYSVPDGKVCLNASGELAVTKFAVEPVSLPAQAMPNRRDANEVPGVVSSGSCRAFWHWFVSSSLPPVATDLLTLTDEGVLRRSLFEHTGGSYPEVSSRRKPRTLRSGN